MSRVPTSLRFERRDEITSLSHAVKVCDMLAREPIPVSWIHHAFGVMLHEPPNKDVLYMKTFDSSYERRQYAPTYAYYERNLWFFDDKPLALSDSLFPQMKSPIVSWAEYDIREDALFWLTEQACDDEPPVTHYGIETFPRLTNANYSR